MEQHVVSVDGIRTSYVAAGRENDEVLLLIHGAGIGVDASLWFPWAESFAERYRVIAPDLLGFGGTQKVVYFDRSAQQQRLDHLAGLCRVLGIVAADVVGHSMGGGLVLQGAIDGSIPVRRAVTIAGPGGILLDRARMAQVHTDAPDREWARSACEIGVADPDDAMVEGRLLRAGRPDHLAVMGAVGVLNRLHPRGDDYEVSFRAALGTIAVPVLIVSGDDDPFTVPGWEHELQALIPGSRVTSYPGARHEPHRSHPEEVADEILRFLTGDVARSSK